MDKKIYKILVCDDDADIVEVTRIILEMENFTVKTVYELDNEAQLLDILRDFQPDAVLMDLRLPKMGGAIATKIIKNHFQFQFIPVIIFSANHAIEKISRQIEADDFIRKPFDIKSLIDVMERLVI